MQAVSQCQEHARAGGVNITSKCKVTVANQKPEKKKEKAKRPHSRKWLNINNNNNAGQGGVVCEDCE